ncbi:MAG: murein biosynthesis integral membrane protein MurJ [Actinomycetes bacterium]
MALGLGNTSGMALGTLLSRVTGVGRDIALVAAIGTGVFSDTYSVANSLPNIIYILIAGGAINAVFIPALVRHMKEDADNGKVFTDRLLTLVGVILIAIVAIALSCAALIVHMYATSSWTGQDFHVAIVFALWCIPQIIFYGIYALESQILNARNVFKLPMFAPIANNVVVITSALFFLALTHLTPTTQSVTSGQLTLLGAGTTLGVIVQAGILFPALRKSGYTFTPRFDFRNSGLGKLGDLAIWTIGFVFVNQVSFLIISKLTTYANVVAVQNAQVAMGFTSYQKGQLMMMLPHSIITVSIITALLPRLSNHSQSKNLSAFAQELSIALRNVITYVIPCAAVLYFMGSQIGVILYGHGAASHDQGAAVGYISSMFAIGLPAFSIFYVLLRTYYAQENTKTPFMFNLGFNALHMSIGLVLYFTVSDNYKVPSLALAYSIAYIFICAITWNRVTRRLPEIPTKALVQLLARVLVAVLLSGLVAWSAATHIFASNSTADALKQIALFTTILAIGYVSLAKIMRINEVTSVVSQIMRRTSSKD